MMTGKNCIITGATSGIGRATAIALGSFGANLILLGRNERAGEAVVREVQRLDNSAMAEFVRVDLSDQAQVAKVAARIAAKHNSIDVLVNNAGARNDKFQKSHDGIEMTFACNHLGHFLLTCLLVDRLIAAPAARVVIVSSGNHGSAPASGKWELPADGYDRRQAYAQSKMANLVFAISLANHLKGTRITSNAYDPGGVASNFSRNNGLLSWGRHLLAHGLRRDLASPGSAADGIVHLARSRELEGVSGRYFRRRIEVRPPAALHDPAVARELWELSVRLTKLDERVGAATWALIRPWSSSSPSSTNLHGFMAPHG